jgi:lipoprotein-releasing system ATP-binding protein
VKTLIETRALQKSFKTAAGELEVIKGIDLTVNRSDMVAIVGASGAGKSTLLHILGALDRPTSGSVSYDGEDIFSLSRNSLASFRNSQIGFVFQFHHLLSEFTALENVMLPALISLSAKRKGENAVSFSEIARRAGRLLSDMGLSGRTTHRPGELSGGEQQRVAVARALILEPGTVLADEPTGNLDTRTGEELFRIFTELNETKGITFIIVTHNESLAGRCHRVVHMEDGRLLE